MRPSEMQHVMQASPRNEHFNFRTLSGAYPSDGTSLVKMYTTAGEKCVVAFRADPGEGQQRSFEILSVKNEREEIDFMFPEPVTTQNWEKSSSLLVKLKPSNFNVVVTEVAVNPAVGFLKQPPTTRPEGQSPKDYIFLLRFPRFDRIYLSNGNLLVGTREGMNPGNAKRTWAKTTQNRPPGAPAQGAREFLKVNQGREVVVLHDRLGGSRPPGAAPNARSQAGLLRLPGLDRVGRPTFASEVDMEALAVRPDGEILVTWQAAPQEGPEAQVRTRYKTFTREGDVILSKWQTEQEVRGNGRKPREQGLIFYRSGELYQGGFSEGRRDGLGSHRVLKVTANMSHIEFEQKTLLYLSKVVETYFDFVSAEHTKSLGNEDCGFRFADMRLAASRFSLASLRDIAVEVAKPEFLRFFEALEPWRLGTPPGDPLNGPPTPELQGFHKRMVERGSVLFPDPAQYLGVFLKAHRVLLEDVAKQKEEDQPVSFITLRQKLAENLERIQAREGQATFSEVLMNPLDKQLHDFLMLFACWQSPENIEGGLGALFGLPRPQEGGEKAGTEAPPSVSKFDGILETLKGKNKDLHRLLSKERDRILGFLEPKFRSAKTDEDGSASYWRSVLERLARKHPCLCVRERETLEAGTNTENRHFLLQGTLLGFWNQTMENKREHLEAFLPGALAIVKGLKDRLVRWDSKKMADLLTDTSKKLLSNSVLSLNQLENLFLVVVSEQEMLQRRLDQLGQDPEGQSRVRGDRGDHGDSRPLYRPPQNLLDELDNKEGDLVRRYQTIRTETLMEAARDEFDMRGAETPQGDDPSGYEVLSEKRTEQTPSGVLRARNRNREDPPGPLFSEEARNRIRTDADMDYGDPFEAELSRALSLVSLMLEALRSIREKSPILRLQSWGDSDQQDCLEKDLPILQKLVQFRATLVEHGVDKLAIKVTQEMRLTRVLQGIQAIQNRIVRKANQVLKALVAEWLRMWTEGMKNQGEDAEALFKELEEADKSGPGSENKEGQEPESQGPMELEWGSRNDIQARVDSVLRSQLKGNLPACLKGAERALRDWQARLKKPSEDPGSQAGRRHAAARMSLGATGTSRGTGLDQTQGLATSHLDRLGKLLDPDQNQSYLSFLAGNMLEKHQNEAMPKLREEFALEMAGLAALRKTVLGSVNFSTVEGWFLAKQIEMEVELLRGFLGTKERAEDFEQDLAGEKDLAVYLSEAQAELLRGFLDSPEGRETLPRSRIPEEQRLRLLGYLDLNLVTDDLHRRTTLRTINHLLAQSLKPLMGNEKKIEEIFRIDEVFLRGALTALEASPDEARPKSPRPVELLEALCQEVAEGTQDPSEFEEIRDRVRANVLRKAQETLEEKIRAWTDLSVNDRNLYLLKPKSLGLFDEERKGQAELQTQKTIRDFEFEGDIDDKAVHSFDQLAAFQQRHFDFFRDLLWNTNRLPLTSASARHSRTIFHCLTPEGYSWQLFLRKAAEPIRSMLLSKRQRDLYPDINEDGLADDAAEWTRNQASRAERLRAEDAAEDARAAEAPKRDFLSLMTEEEQSLQREMEAILEDFALEKVNQVVQQQVYHAKLEHLYPYSQALSIDRFQKMMVDLNLASTCETHAKVWALGSFEADEVRFGLRLGAEGSVYLGHFENSLYHGQGVLFQPRGPCARARFKFEVKRNGASQFEPLSEKDLVGLVGKKAAGGDPWRADLRVSRVDQEFPGDDQAKDCQVFDRAQKDAGASFWDQLTMSDNVGSRNVRMGVKEAHDVAFLGLGVGKLSVNFPYTCFKGQWEDGQFLKTEKPETQGPEKPNFAFFGSKKDQDDDPDNFKHLLRRLPFWAEERSRLGSSKSIPRTSGRELRRDEAPGEDEGRADQLPITEQEKIHGFMASELPENFKTS